MWDKRPFIYLIYLKVLLAGQMIHIGQIGLILVSSYALEVDKKSEN